MVSTGAWATMDGNEATARVAYALSEVIAIYPITPASPMGEAADSWSASGRLNHWGSVPEVVEMQSEAGAAGALHGAVMGGALGTSFTASQGLLLMIPNMFKIAGELTPAVLHVAARTVATHALSIFGDHSDVMATRSTGWATLFSTNVQEAHDLAAVAHAASLESRVPFLHAFDGFRTSHEVSRIATLTPDDLDGLIDPAWIDAHRARGLTPDHPSLRGSAQNPDVFFQAREAANTTHSAVVDIVRGAFDRLAERTGRRYDVVEYHGHPEAERVTVIMGSGVHAARQAVDALVAAGERVGVVTVRLYRPFPTDALLAALPPTVQRVAVLDRTKEPGAIGEPLFVDVTTALAEAFSRGERRAMPLTMGVRYGLASKEFTPAMARAVFDELALPTPRPRATVGIIDDVTHLSLPVDTSFTTDTADVRAVFFGLGSDGTVGANKTAAKIVGEQTDRFVQGYFVYDSKKSGAVTVSHLRFDDEPIHSPYLISAAGFVACHHAGLLDRLDVLDVAERGATLLLNMACEPDEVWGRLPVEVQHQILDKSLHVFTVDAERVARSAGMPGRINAVMLPCFFALSGVLPPERAVAEIKASFAAMYVKRGQTVVERNEAAVDAALAALHRVPVPATATSALHRRPPVTGPAPAFVERVTATLLAGHGDRLPVSALPVDGVFPTGTARYEKRQLALALPIWDPDICIDCAKCALVCPHAAIRMAIYDPVVLADIEGGDALPTKAFRSRDLPGHNLTIQVAPDDCTGCGVCVDMCPARSKTVAKHKAIDMLPATEHRDVERSRWETFEQLPPLERSLVDHATVKGSQALEPLFEFSGACAGCGETPYLKLLTQLFGDRAIVANATGCSSIYGGNLPTTPWSTGADGRGPAWANSLFEDNAEFGLGLRLAVDTQAALARTLVGQLADRIGPMLAAALLESTQHDEAAIAAQRTRVEQLHVVLAGLVDDADPMVASRAQVLAAVADDLVRRSVWIVGGDGWAYDIGFSGLDHVLASGRDVNVLVLDTEVYSNTGGQASKATARAAVAKFATGGKRTPKKDLGMDAAAYGNVYVAQVAMGANDIQTVKAFAEAEAWPGPSLIIAYSTCIAHGIDMATSMHQQRDAVQSGYWPLYRFHPGLGEHEHPFHLDSHPPSIPFSQFAENEGRFAMLHRSDPETAVHLSSLAQADIDERWRFYEQLAGVERTIVHEADIDGSNPPEEPS
jgi:pyruvate-ferredoxin/flavodoxin oxidoreductase